MRAVEIFEGSNGTVTRAYYAELEKRGPEGFIAMNLFRAQKCSTRAKMYRGGVRGGDSYRAMAYERKQWSLGLLAEALEMHGEKLGIVWGWATDSTQDFNPWVMYIELPQGQVSFHSPTRGKGPAYGKPWDGQRESGRRILQFCDQVFQQADPRQERLAL